MNIFNKETKTVFHTDHGSTQVLIFSTHQPDEDASGNSYNHQLMKEYMTSKDVSFLEVTSNDGISSFIVDARHEALVRALCIQYKQESFIRGELRAAFPQEQD